MNLDDRTKKFAIDVRNFIANVKRNIYFESDIIQLVRSSGSVGANYIEANECLSSKDFYYRIKICLKEAKESRYWLKVIKESNTINEQEVLSGLINEATELIKIFSSIVLKGSKRY